MFYKQLRKLRKEKGYSQKELAKQLGIGQTTIANYEKGIREPNYDILKGIAELLDTSIDVLMGTEVASYEPIDEESLVAIRKAYLKALLSNNETEAEKLVLSRGNSHDNVVLIIEKVIVKSLYLVGDMWFNGLVDVAKEHYITAVSDTIVSRLIGKLTISEQNRGTAICLTNYSEAHTLGLKIISAYLRSFGYDVFYVGSGTPMDSFRKSLVELKPTLIAISVTLPKHIDSAITMINTIREEMGNQTRIVAGGQGFEDEVINKLQVNGYATDYKSLKALIESFE